MWWLLIILPSFFPCKIILLRMSPVHKLLYAWRSRGPRPLSQHRPGSWSRGSGPATPYQWAGLSLRDASCRHLSHPHPCLLLLSALSGLLRTSLFLTSIIYTRVHKRDGFQRVIIWSTFFNKEMQALTWKSLQEPAHYSERSVSSGARQTWVWAHVLSTHLIPDQLLHFSEPQFTYWQNRDNNMSLGRLFWGSVIMALKAWCFVGFYYIIIKNDFCHHHWFKEGLKHHWASLSLWKSRQRIKKERHHFADFDHSQSYGFSSSHVWIWEADHKEGCTPKNWCFQTVMLEKTLEHPLDCKGIAPVNPKGNQLWIFIGRTHPEAEALILWPPDVKSQLTEKHPDAGKD